MGYLLRTSTVFLSGSLVVGAASQQPPVDAVVAAAAAYVREYQARLSSVVADETYVQQIASAVPIGQPIPRYRKTTGEVFFMFAPGGDEWMAVRDLAVVDGQAIKDRLKVLDELKRLPVQEVVAAFKAHNSKFNIGRTSRNFNEPTLTLRVFGADHIGRFAFQQKRVERKPDGALVVLAFAEKRGPTLIRDLTHGAVLSSGEVTVEPVSGQIRRTLLTAVAGAIRFEMITDYVLDKRLGTWVPDRFRERYQHGNAPTSVEAAADYEDVVCEARYANYRRFETTAKIIK